MSDATDNRFYREKQEQPSSKEHCQVCGNAPDITLRHEIDRLTQQNANQRELIERRETQLSERLQQLEELRMAERLNVETVAALQKERDELQADLEKAIANHSADASSPPPAVTLLCALRAAYLTVLREPINSWRISHQPLYAHLRDAIAELQGRDPESVQNQFEDDARLPVTKVTSQHEETGRLWEGPRDQMPKGYSAVETMAMLPNDKHPGPGCSCRECLHRFPVEKEASRNE